MDFIKKKPIISQKRQDKKRMMVALGVNGKGLKRLAQLSKLQKGVK